MQVTGVNGSARPPSRLPRLADRVLTRMAALDAATTGYTITRDIPVPMRDGQSMSTSLD